MSDTRGGNLLHMDGTKIYARDGSQMNWRNKKLERADIPVKICWNNRQKQTKKTSEGMDGARENCWATKKIEQSRSQVMEEWARKSD